MRLILTFKRKIIPLISSLSTFKKRLFTQTSHFEGTVMAAGDYIIVALMLATFGVLMAGVVLMGVGGTINARYGNKLMVARVSLQGLVLLMLALLFFVGNK
jgi:hypothetical protein